MIWIFFNVCPPSIHMLKVYPHGGNLIQLWWSDLGPLEASRTVLNKVRNIEDITKVISKYPTES